MARCLVCDKFSDSRQIVSKVSSNHQMAIYPGRTGPHNAGLTGVREEADEGQPMKPGFK
jgi:hypothetical protein